MKAILSLGISLLWSICCIAQEVPVLVKDLVAGPESSFKLNHYEYQLFTATSEAFYFYTHSENEGVSFWRSDGSSQGTYPLITFSRNAAFENLIITYKTSVQVAAVGNNLYFMGYDPEHGIELWHSDGTIEGTKFLADLMPGTEGSGLFGITNFNDKVLFFANGLNENEEVFPHLWMSEGSAENTTKLKQFQSVFNHYNVNIVTDDKLAYFRADDGIHGSELWKTDGTAAGTLLLKDLIEGSGSSNAAILTPSNGQLYFSLFHPEYGFEPWISDGTTEGTRLLKDIYPGELGSYPGLFIPIGDKVYFRARKWGDAAETIHVTDGTPEGTMKIGDGGESGTGNWIAFKERLFYHNPPESQLKSTVDAPGNIQVHAELTAPMGRFLAASDTVLYFTASGAGIGYELWRTNGTQEGTYLVGDINTVPHEGSYPNKAFIFKGEVYFMAEDKTHGRELWKATHPSNVISGNVYFDANKNGLFDKQEIPLNHQSILIEPGNTILYTDHAGYFSMAPEPGTYTVKVLPADDWKLSSSPDHYTFDIPGATNEKAVFGLSPLTERQELGIELTASRSRCGFEATYWLYYTNKGNVISDGQVQLKHDPRATLVDTNPPPASYEDDTFSWNFENLYPTERRLISLTFTMPGVEFLGDTLTFFSQASITGTDLVERDTLQQEITCAYDPNDKLVKPAGIEEEHYTLKNSWLDYTIRFQNTGNDTAFVVVLRDTLDINLDLSTFEIISSSHNMQASRKDRALEFKFDHILLPDSNRNEPGSHGYVRYRIKAKAGVAENTVVENKAYIFFDFNPAIETNTTFNTLVTTLPQRVVSGLKDQDQELKIYPNPTDGYISLRAKDPIREILVYNPMGILIHHQAFTSLKTEQNISLENKPAGIYLIRVRAGRGYLQQKLVKH